MEAFAKPYPARMIAGVMGAPLDDAPRLGVWANLIQGQFDPVKIATMLPELERASTEFVEYVDDLIQKRKGDPQDDLITKLIEAEEDGDRLSETEMAHLVSAVLVGGVDTTQAQLAHGIRLFAAHPEQWAALAENPAEMAKAAADEVLRYEPITPLTARITLEDVEFRDIRFPQGTVILACALTANRDPESYERGRGLRHHRGPRPRQAAHVRCRPALLPRREPGPRRAGGGVRVPGSAHE